jgi:hypothetical protein
MTRQSWQPWKGGGATEKNVFNTFEQTLVCAAEDLKRPTNRDTIASCCNRKRVSRIRTSKFLAKPDSISLPFN